MIEKEQAERLLKTPWEKIVSSGGIIGEKKSSDAYVTFGGFLVHLGKRWLSLNSTEVSLGKGRDNYDFFIEVCEGNFPLDPELAKRNNPRISLVETFPDDCRLDYLRDFGVEKLEYEIHPKSYTNYYDDVNYDLLLATPLIVTCKNGVKFKIEPSEESLACLEISMIS